MEIGSEFIKFYSASTPPPHTILTLPTYLLLSFLDIFFYSLPVYFINWAGINMSSTSTGVCAFFFYTIPCSWITLP